MVSVQPIEPGHLIGAQDMGAGLYAAVQVVGSVPAADLFEFSALVQPLVCILTQRLKQAVAFSPGGFQVRHDQRFVHQTCQEIHHVRDCQAGGASWRGSGALINVPQPQLQPHQA